MSSPTQTDTVYLMHENVKYKDKDGTVKEKDISLKSRAGRFGITQSDVELLIPTSPTQGIDLGYLGYDIRLTPQGLMNAATAVQSDNSVVYDRAYGENTKLVYTPLLSGVKEDIVLSAYTESATYTFLLETDGLTLYNGDGGYYLANSGKSEPIFRLGKILIYDAIGKPDIGTMTATTVTENERYLLTVSADDAFLVDPSTVYPVTVDPSITVSDNTASGSIVDAPIFEGCPNINFGTFVYNRLGTPDETEYGVGRTVVKLSGLTSSNEYQTIAADQITNVTFFAKEASGGSSQYINLYPLTGSTTWTETSVTWNNIGSHDTPVNYGNTMYNGHVTEFNITNLIKAWKNGRYSADAGFILTNENEANDKCFYSSECSNSSFRPYAVMTYEPVITLSSTSASVAEGGTVTLTATTKPSGQTVTWSTNKSSVATVSSSGVVTAHKTGTATITARMIDTDGVERVASCVIHAHIASGVYRLKNVDNGMYLDVTGGGVKSGTEIQQWSRAVSDTNRNQIFKIVYLGTYGSSDFNYYCIRSMTNSAMGVHAPYNSSGENVTLQTMSTYDSWNSISYNQSWAMIFLRTMIRKAGN